MNRRWFQMSLRRLIWFQVAVVVATYGTYLTFAFHMDYGLWEVVLAPLVLVTLISPYATVVLMALMLWRGCSMTSVKARGSAAITEMCLVLAYLMVFGPLTSHMY